MIGRFKLPLTVLFSIGLSVSSLSAFAQKNTLDLESTFKGNQEQPKVLYIVPWQAIEAPPASYRPLQSLIQQNFRLLDREEFRREVVYRKEALSALEGKVGVID